MKNTKKRLLSLALVLVLAAALAVPAFAIRRQLSFWPDADLFHEEYRQAAEVMVYHGIIEGDEGGLRPLDTITRAEACKIITFILEGPDAGEMEGVIAHTWYTDVPSDEWYTSYVEYCTEAGIVSGDKGDGTGPFRPNDKITGYEFGKMCLCAIGYNSVYEGFETDAWQSEIARLAEDVGTYYAMLTDWSWDAPITRQEAFQMAVAAMEKDRVIPVERDGVVVGYSSDTLAPVLWAKYHTEHIVDWIVRGSDGTSLVIMSQRTGEEYILGEEERPYEDWIVSAYVENIPGDVYIITLRHLTDRPYGYEFEDEDNPDPALLEAGQKVYTKNGLTIIVFDEFVDDNFTVHLKLYIENNNDFIVQLSKLKFSIPDFDDYELSDYLYIDVGANDYVVYPMMVYYEEMRETGVSYPFTVRLAVYMEDPNDSTRVFNDTTMDIVVDPYSYDSSAG